MSKFFLKPPKPMFSSKDYRILSFIQLHNSLKKFKQFQTKRIIKALKAAPTKQLENQLQVNKNISSNTLNNLTVYLLNKLLIQLPKYQTFLNKQISTSVQDALNSIEAELSKQQQIFDFFNKYQKSSLFTKAKQASLMLKQKQKKRVKTLEKRAQKKNQSTEDKFNSPKIQNKTPKKIQPFKKLHNGNKQQVSIRYSNKPVNLSQLKPKPEPNSHDNRGQRPVKEMHPSWAAKKQQQLVAAFSGTKKSLI